MSGCSFRPVALSLPLSEVAALADAMARALLHRPRRPRTLALAFAYRLRAGADRRQYRPALAEAIEAESAPRRDACVVDGAARGDAERAETIP